VLYDQVSCQRQDCESYGVSGFFAFVGATWSFCGCYLRVCWACLVFKGVFRARLNVSRPHALQKGRVAQPCAGILFRNWHDGGAVKECEL